MQVLEGGRAPVSALYNRIARIPRHRDIVLLSYEEIGERSFSGWSMGQVSMSRLNPSLLLKYSESAVLDPYAVSGKASLASSTSWWRRPRWPRELAERHPIAARVSAAPPRRAWPRLWRVDVSPLAGGFFCTVVTTGPIGLA
jgi:hypothetical protein